MTKNNINKISYGMIPHKIIYIFGNPDLEFDSLPLKILPKLKKRFPDIVFETKDPNENWDTPDDFICIDTVHGLGKPEVFYNLDKFSSSPRSTMHDFDALANLLLLKKLGRIKKIKIIGLTPTMKEKEAFDFVSRIILSN